MTRAGLGPLQKALGSYLAPGRARRVDTEARERRQFKALAAQAGFSFVKTRDGFLEISPCPALPAGLVTAHYGWPETLDRVRACLANPALVVDGCYSE